MNPAERALIERLLVDSMLGGNDAATPPLQRIQRAVALFGHLGAKAAAAFELLLREKALCVPYRSIAIKALNSSAAAACASIWRSCSSASAVD